MKTNVLLQALDHAGNWARCGVLTGVAALSLALPLAAAAAADHGQTAQQVSDSQHKGQTSGAITLSERVQLRASAETVWSTVRDFDAPDVWMPGVTGTMLIHGKNNQPGAVRRLTLDNGSTATERLLDWSGHDKRYTYQITHSSLPATHYRSTLAVQADGDDSAYVVWEARFDPAGKKNVDEAREAREAVKQYYVQALTHLRRMLSAN